MTVLVTGADGFVGRELVRQLLAEGRAVRAGCRPGGRPGFDPAVAVVPLELEDPASVEAALDRPVDAVVHLAALASGGEARRDPGLAWSVNAAGTARLLHAVERNRERHGGDPLVLLVSTGEVYGAGPARPRTEDDPVRPCSPYAASKAGAELAAAEAVRRAGLRVVVARPFAHTGPGQTELYVAPAFARRLADARRSGATRVPVGNLEPVRDLLDMRDVARAYRALLDHGEPGMTYNIARGEGISLAQLFERLAALIGVAAVPVPDPALVRPADVPHLVGDPARLTARTGWRPAIPLEQTLRDLVDAQAN